MIPSIARAFNTRATGEAVTPELDDSTLIFDARLLRIDNPAGWATFTAAGIDYRRRLSFPGFWGQGTVGLLCLPPYDDTFAFYSYPDQRLRRAPECDPPNQQDWGWSIEEYRFTVKRGILPGLSGAVIRDDTRALEIRLAPEFDDWCARHQLDPVNVLRTFIADVCGITDSRRRPREDGYCSSGAHERFLAREYVRRVYPALPSPDTPRLAKDATTGSTRDDY
jgi:hypothetical protein